MSYEYARHVTVALVKSPNYDQQSVLRHSNHELDLALRQHFDSSLSGRRTLCLGQLFAVPSLSEPALCYELKCVRVEGASVGDQDTNNSKPLLVDTKHTSLTLSETSVVDSCCSWSHKYASNIKK